MTYTVKVDSKGRLTIPAELRQSLGIEPGDTLFVEVESASNSETYSRVLRYAKADNPFDALAHHAEGERRAGRTCNLRDFARDHDIDLDAG